MDVHLMDIVLALLELVHESALSLDSNPVCCLLEGMNGSLYLESVCVLSNLFEPVVHDSFCHFEVCHLHDTFDMVCEWENEGFSQVHAITGDERVHCVSEI